MLALGVILKVFNQQYSRGNKHLELLLAVKPDMARPVYMVQISPVSLYCYYCFYLLLNQA